MTSVIPQGVPFAQIPHDIICDADMPHAAFRVYCYLMRRADSEGRAFPGIRRIAAETGMGRNTARRGIEVLEDAGWVEVEREYDPATQKHDVNRYTIHGTRVGSGRTQGVPEVDPGGGATTDTELDPVLTTSTELQVAATPRNPWWDATVALFGDPSGNQITLYGRFVTMAKDWPPAEIRRRAGQLVELWGVKSVTVASLEKHWSRFDAQIGSVTAETVEAYAAAEDRAATLERLADE